MCIPEPLTLWSLESSTSMEDLTPSTNEYTFSKENYTCELEGTSDGEGHFKSNSLAALREW